jgi:RNA-directed DNA polymerase
MVWLVSFNMKTHKNLYSKIYNITNLHLSFKKARKGKTKRDYVKEFEKNLWKNLIQLQKDLKNQTYKPKPLQTFILRDPKTRKISKSDFRDRIVHHALCNVIEPIFDKSFIYDSCANRKGKGNLFAIKRFYKFMRKVSRNGKLNGWFKNSQIKGYCLKADIKHYFQEVDCKILLNIIKRKIRDEKVIWLIKKILENQPSHYKVGKGMPLGNLTSQFFANIYLNELDYFIKHKLKAKYYIRYVDDFVILNSSKEKLQIWGGAIDDFLKQKLKIELHTQKTNIIPLSIGVDFVGFRNYYYFRLLRKRNIKNMLRKVDLWRGGGTNHLEIIESLQGWNAYAMWGNTFKLRAKTMKTILDITNTAIPPHKSLKSQCL